MLMNQFPQQGDIVIATVKKIVQFGAFCALDEFAGQDAFVHISEVSPGWVRNVRDYVKEGQKIVALVVRVDTQKRQVDLSLKRIGEAEKKRKMEAYNLDKRASKLLERVAIKIGKKDDVEKIAQVIREKYDDLYSAFELAAKGEELGLPAAWAQGIQEVAKQEIKPKIVSVRALLKLKSFSQNGLQEVKQTLSKIKSVSTKGIELSVKYVGAPVYYVDITSPDYKTADKVIAKIEALLSSLPASMDWQLKKRQ